jgi:hypothetical protein
MKKPAVTGCRPFIVYLLPFGVVILLLGVMEAAYFFIHIIILLLTPCGNFLFALRYPRLLSW